MDPTLTHRQGYLDGYRGRDGAAIAAAHDAAEQETGSKLAGEGETDYWHGFYHGRYDRHHGKPCSGAVERGEIPDIL